MKKQISIVSVLMIVCCILYLSVLDIPSPITASTEWMTTKLDETSILSNDYSAVTINEDKKISLQRENKSFIYEAGESFIRNGEVFISSENQTFNLLIYDWYYLDYFNGYVYAADVLTNIKNPENNMVTGIFIYPQGVNVFANQDIFDIDQGKTTTIELIYTNSDSSIAYKIFSPLSDYIFKVIKEVSQYYQIDNEKEDFVSEVLTTSLSFENMFKSSMYNDMTVKHLTENELRSLPSYGYYANSNLTVPRNAYDKYTDTDGYITDYINTYRNKVHTFYGFGLQIAVSDDPITHIIPKSLFVNRGVYSFIGKEYGFYIKTIQDYGEDNRSDFIVFDITSTHPYPGRMPTAEAPSVRIRPLFSGSVRYSTGWGGVVVYDGYLNPYLALANIQVAGSINNLYQSNIGDPDYVASQDFGYAFNSLHYDAVGVGIKRDSISVNLSWAKTAFGAAKILNTAYPGVGTIVAVGGKALISGLELGVDYYYTHSRTNYTSMDKLADGSYKLSNTILGNANTVSMINNYGNLVKGFETDLLNSEKSRETECPLLYKSSGHYFFTQYNFTQKNSDINWDSLVATQIALDIYRDDTGYILFFIKTGSCDKMDSVTGGRVDYYNEIPSNSNGGTISEGMFYHTEFTTDTNGMYAHGNESFTPTEGSYKDFYFTPNRTYSYVIETMNRAQNTDPLIKLYDSSGNRIAYNDDGGTAYGNGSLNSRIEVTLVGGQTYRLRTLTYNYRSGYYEFIIRKNASLLEGNSSSLYPNQTVVSNDAIWYTFKPTTTGFYTFYSIGTTDTYLTVFDSIYNQYAFDDDSGTGLNAQIDLYLIAGKNYYIKAHRYGMYSGTFNLYVNRQRIIQIHPLSQTSDYSYSFNQGEANFFRFTPRVTQSYTFYTYKYDGDPYLYLYDNNMSLLAQDDDGYESGLNAKITYTLQAGKTYYIRVRGFSNSSGSGSLYCTY